MVRTRFAPSPTGFLHIGGVRTALFNWLFARRHGGQFLLRIDDTDAERNVQEALQPILEGFRWLGIDWDEGPEVGGPYEPYYQSQRLVRYQEAAAKLIESGQAYYDYSTKEELDEERQAAQAEKRPFLYSRRWMAETPEDRAKFEAEGRSHVVRLKMPREGSLVLQDEVRGEVTFEWALEQDHVIQRADGTCLYHLANVVDDEDFQITHVIRAEEHLPNTARQVFIAEALGYKRPIYAHVPFVAEPGSKTKLSKRKIDKYLKIKEFADLHAHGMSIANAIGLETSDATFNPVLTEFYEKVGYLPEALNNYLLLLGWSLDDHTEFLTRDEMIANFSLERVTKAPASFDPKKLWSFQDHYMLQLPVAKKVDMMLPYLERAGFLKDTSEDEARAKLAEIVAASGDRLKTAGDILTYAPFFFQPDESFDYDEKAFQKRLGKAGALEHLAGFRDVLATLPNFTASGIEEALNRYCEEHHIKSGELIHPIRIGTTGQGVGPGVFDCVAILGREASLRRIDRTLREAPQRVGG